MRTAAPAAADCTTPRCRGKEGIAGVRDVEGQQSFLVGCHQALAALVYNMHGRISISTLQAVPSSLWSELGWRQFRQSVPPLVRFDDVIRYDYRSTASGNPINSKSQTAFCNSPPGAINLKVLTRPPIRAARHGSHVPPKIARGRPTIRGRRATRDDAPV